MMTLICGHTRAGKTTYSQRFDNVIHFDDIRSRSKVIKMVTEADSDIVVEGIYYAPEERAELCKAYNGFTRCIFIDTPDDIRAKRMGRKIIHPYPFLKPTYDEGWDDIVVIRGDQWQQ